MRLALIYPPFYHKKFNENLPTTDDEFGLFPHIGFGWVAAAAKAAGVSVRLFDAAAIKTPYELVLKQVKEFNPDLLGFAAHSTQTFRDMLLWARRMKRDTGLPILAGGYEAKAYPFEIMEHDAFDFLCVGEAITFIPAFVEAFQKGGGYDKVPDLLYREHGEARRTHDAPHIPFSHHPMPDRSIFPNEMYYSMVSQKRKFTIGMSEVGCPYPCTFCSMRHTGFDARTPEQLADEMEIAWREYGIHEVDWFDPIMLYNRERMLEFARELKRRKLPMIWSARARVDSVSFLRPDGPPDEEMIAALAESGCRRLFFGIESGDDQILKNMKKGTIVSKQKRVLDCVVAHGIRPLGFFMIGNPGETEETARKTINHARSLPLDYTQFTLTMIKPHTELEQKYIFEATGIDYWREYLRGTVEERILPTPWTTLSRADIERLAKRAYLSFYLRPGYILKMLLRIETKQEFARYVRVALQMMFRPLRPARIGGISLPQRLVRFAGAFMDGALASLNRGARHPASFFGGGLRGAWGFARYEWKRSTSTEDMAAPGSVDEELMELDAHLRIRRLDGFPGESRYVPLSLGALGAMRPKSRAG